MDCPSLVNPDKVSDNHMEELYQATPEELKENRRLLQVQGENNPFTHTLFLDRALKKAQVRAFLSGQGPQTFRAFWPIDTRTARSAYHLVFGSTGSGAWIPGLICVCESLYQAIQFGKRLSIAISLIIIGGGFIVNIMELTQKNTNTSLSRFKIDKLLIFMKKNWRTEMKKLRKEESYHLQLKSEKYGWRNSDFRHVTVSIQPVLERSQKLPFIVQDKAITYRGCCIRLWTLVLYCILKTFEAGHNTHTLDSVRRKSDYHANLERSLAEDSNRTTS